MRLSAIRRLFESNRYKHRDSSLGDFVASQLYEDLVALNKSATLVRRVQTHECIVNLTNKAVGKPMAGHAYVWGYLAARAKLSGPIENGQNP